MPAPEPRHRTQEQSIKARKHELFETDEGHLQTGPRRSFAQCLRETPAAPLSSALRATLWVVGSLVVLMLLAALAQSVTRKPRARPRPALEPAAARPALRKQITANRWNQDGRPHRA